MGRAALYPTAQKPSELLAEMLRLCTRGRENNAFFNCWFLNKLPRKPGLLILEADMAEKQALDARANLFAAHNRKQYFIGVIDPEGDLFHVCLVLYCMKR